MGVGRGAPDYDGSMQTGDSVEMQRADNNSMFKNSEEMIEIQELDEENANVVTINLEKFIEEARKSFTTTSEADDQEDSELDFNTKLGKDLQSLGLTK